MDTSTEYYTAHDHRMIFDELKAIREDLREVMTITRKEMAENLKEIKDDITAMRQSQTDTDRIARESLLIAKNARTVIWGVGGVVILMVITSLWKLIGGP